MPSRDYTLHGLSFLNACYIPGFCDPVADTLVLYGNSTGGHTGDNCNKIADAGPGHVTCGYSIVSQYAVEQCGWVLTISYTISGDSAQYFLLDFTGSNTAGTYNFVAVLSGTCVTWPATMVVSFP
jgi:hypothetical protein